MRHERLNRLAKVNDARTYLEIGVEAGNTFFKVDVPDKVAVDPKFRFDVADHPGSRYFEITSDEFFAQHAVEFEGTFDLIYLDGLHTFEQCLRDFCATQHLANDRTIWLIDDTVPVTYASSLPVYRQTLKVREETGDEVRAWMGDVFKVVFMLHDFFPQFSFATSPGHGQTTVWQSPRPDFAPKWNSPRQIAELNFADFLMHKELLRIQPDAETLEEISPSRRRRVSQRLRGALDR